MAKEILKEEVMTEKELDGVAGGTIAETVKDTQFLHALGLMDKAYDAEYCKAHLNEVEGAIDVAVWGLAGNHSSYSAHLSANSQNKYTFSSNGEPTETLSRELFYARICNAAGKPDFDYKKYL